MSLLVDAFHAEKSWGNIHARRLGIHKVRVNKSDTNLYTITEFTYPEVSIFLTKNAIMTFFYILWSKFVLVIDSSLTQILIKYF